MTTAIPLATPAAPAQTKLYRAILWSGMTAGVMDLTAAFVQSTMRGSNPVRLLQLIATGLLGADSYDGGMATAALGAVCHFVIAFSAATVFCITSRRLHFLFQHPFVSGIGYGVAVYAFMNLVVLPLSAFPYPISFPLRNTIIGLLTHMTCVGLPISLANHWCSK